MFPWNKSSNFPFQMNDMLKNMNPKDVEKYVNDVMTQVFGESFSPSMIMREDDNQVSEETKVEELPIDVIETSEYVFVKVPLSDENHPIKIRHTHHTLHIIQSSEVELQKIMLPAPVRRKGTKAFIKEQTLEIQLTKMEDVDYTEIEITP